MPSFFARQYMRDHQAVGNTEKVVGVVILLLLAGIITAFVVDVRTNKDYLFDVRLAVLANPFPDPGVPGWSAPGKVSRFAPDNLYEKIDGRAGLYLQFHVAGLTFGTYYGQADASRMFDVYWYDMGEPVNASGIYQAEKPPDVAPASIGTEGYETGGAVFFRKGSCYVQVLPASLDTTDSDVSLKIAQLVAERIECKEEGGIP